MRNRRLATIALLATAVLGIAALAWIVASRGSPEEPDTAAPPETMTASASRLANGLEVELVSGPCGDRTAIAVLYAVGADHDPPGRSGMAHLVARLMARAGEGDRVVESGRDHTLEVVLAPAGGLDAALDGAAARIAGGEITQSDLDAARAEVLADIAERRGGDAMRMAESYAAESVQPTGGEGWRGGVAAEVEAITLDEVQAFRRASYGPASTRVVVVGRFDAAAVRGRLERALGALAPGAAPAAREPAGSQVTGTLVMGDAPAAVALAIPAPAAGDPRYPPFLVLVARLLDAPSAQRAWTARYDPVALPETLFVTAALAPGEHGERLAGQVRSEVDAIVARPLAPGEATAARDRFASWLGLRDLEPATCIEDPRAIAAARARRAQLGVDGSAIAEALEGTTPEQLGEAAALFAGGHVAAVVAGGAIR